MSIFNTCSHAPAILHDVQEQNVNYVAGVPAYMKQNARIFNLKGVTNDLIQIVRKYCKFPLHLYNCGDLDDTIHVYQDKDILYLFIRYCGPVTPKYHYSLVHASKFYVIRPHLSQMILPHTTTVININIPFKKCSKRDTLAEPLKFEFMVIGLNPNVFTIQKFIDISKKSKFTGNRCVMRIIEDLQRCNQHGGENIDIEHQPDIMFMECTIHDSGAMWMWYQKYEPRLQSPSSNPWCRKKNYPEGRLKLQLKLFKESMDRHYRVMFQGFQEFDMQFHRDLQYYMVFNTYVCICEDTAGTLVTIDYDWD